jgi:hypothetical protein
LSKNALTLDEIINGYVIKGDPILASLLQEADMRHDAIFYSISLKDKVFESIEHQETAQRNLQTSSFYLSK